MPSKDFTAVVDDNGVQTKQLLRIGNFNGDAEAAKKWFEDLHTKVPSGSGKGKKIVSITEIGDTPIEDQKSVEAFVGNPPVVPHE